MPIDPDTFDAVVGIYQGEIDSLIQNLGKDVTLYFFDQLDTVDANNDFFDPIRGNTTKKPNYKGNAADIAPNDVITTRTIKALVKVNPSDFDSFGDIKVQNPNAIVRLKTFVTDVPDLIRCRWIIPNIDVQGIIGLKYRLIRTPVPVGLQQDRYAISFWSTV